MLNSLARRFLTGPIGHLQLPFASASKGVIIIIIIIIIIMIIIIIIIIIIIKIFQQGAHFTYMWFSVGPCKNKIAKAKEIVD